ncbi:MAG: ABC transporter ATP-binding protein [Candidatus Latescibacterota bacterium]|nr:MAG: ABC transporter ATP-binding protein [Candidatus Latescibacterota bacterium]
MVECEDLMKIYKTGKIEVVALRGLDLRVDKGELRAIVGPSGSGKTTLLNIVGAITKPTAGKVYVDGINIVDLSEKDLVEYRRKKVGMVFQFFNLVPTLTALENVELPMVLVGTPRSERKRRAKELLRLVGLEERMNHKPAELSGGEQQRVAIAAALANDPPLLLADEPTGELDSVTGMKIADLFRRLNKELGKTMIIVTHDISVARLADRISRIMDGKIVETIIPAEMKVAEEVGPSLHDRIVELEERKAQIQSEIDNLKELMAKNKISPDEFVERYQTLKRKLDEIEMELSRLRV